MGEPHLQTLLRGQGADRLGRESDLENRVDAQGQVGANGFDVMILGYKPLP